MLVRIVGPLLMLVVAGAVSADSDEFNAVNRVRSAAGLAALVAEPRLADAATRHAAYLDRHREPADSGKGLSAHLQQAGHAGYSGATPGERAVAAGYPHRAVLENVSMGYPTADAAMRGLMSAIYHRFTFLDLTADQLGVARGTQSRVFLLGRSDLVTACEVPPAEALYQAPLDCLGTPMRRDYYDALCAALPDAALFTPSHPVSCPDGTRLDARYMAAVCAQPPVAALFSGHGRYFEPCDNGRRIAADWFLGLCAGRVGAAVYEASGNYFEICDGRRVSAEWFEALCAVLPDEARYTDSWRYRRPCAAPLDVRVEYLDRLDAQRLTTVPESVVWPPPAAHDVPPAFFIEEPDPLPDLAVSGYPVSVQFNPALVGEVRLGGFRLYRLDDGAATELTKVRLLDSHSDPHQLLSAHEFALFPLQRLDWGGEYLAVVEAALDGRAQRIEWRFTTAGSGLPVLTAAQAAQRFEVRSGVDYLLYLPPSTEHAETVLSSRSEFRRGNALSVEAVDSNTLRVRVDAPLCDLVRMHFDSGREVELVPAGCADQGLSR